MNDEIKGLVLGIVAVTIFGLTLPATRVVTPYADPIFIGLGRACVASVVAALILLNLRPQTPTRRQLKQLCIVALGVVIGFPVLSAWAMQTLPASHGGVVLGFLPLATVIASRIVSDERPSFGFWVAASIGSVLVVFYALLEGGGAFALGDITLIGAIISAAFGYAVGGKLSKDMGGWQVICWALLISFPFTLLPALYSLPNTDAGFSIQAIIAFLYLALASQLFGFFIWYKAMAIGGVARVSQTQLLQPFVTLAASALILSESIDNQTIGFAIGVVIFVAIGKRMPIYEKQ